MSNTAGGAIETLKGPTFPHIHGQGPSSNQRTTAPKSSMAAVPAKSQLQLLASGERCLDALTQLTNLLADVRVDDVAAAPKLQ